MDEDLTKYDYMLKDYFDTKKKINCVNDKILNYKKLKEDDKACEEVLSAQKDLIEIYISKIKNYVFIDTILKTELEYANKILTDKYLKNKSWQAVALNNYISVRQCFNIKNRVLEKIKEEYLKLNI